jgi:phenylacetate-CoA ligase
MEGFVGWAFLEPLLRLVAAWVVYPLADLKNGSPRLREARRLRRSQWWSAADLEALRTSRLKAIVEHARQSVPYYRERFKSAGSVTRIEDLPNLPLLRKADLRRAGTALLQDASASHDLLSAKTGGSTGESLVVFFDDDCRQYRNAAAMRSDGWAGWRHGSSVAALWGNPPIPRGWRQKLFSLLHERVIYCDTMLINDDVVRSFNAEMSRKGVRYIFGHAHSIFRYCESIERQRLVPPPVRGVVSTSMMLLQPERMLIERVLGCRVTNRYGCEEVGLIASECEEHDGLHINEEHVVVELVGEDGRPVPEGQPGLVCVTDLINRKMPLIRYVVEDLAVLNSRPCRCGRLHQRLDRIVGRTADFLKRRDGSLVAGVSLVERTLTALPGLARLQVIQEATDRVLLNVVPDASYDNNTADRLVAEFRSALGDGIKIGINLVDNLVQERNGKYRFAICKC